MPTTYTLDISRKNLTGQYRAGGQGRVWLDRVRLTMHRKAESMAPSRTGTLVSSHRSSIRGINQWRCIATIMNIAPHAGWVHGGTDGSEGNPLMVLPAGGPGRNTVSPYAGSTFTRRKKRFVNGQEENPWLDDACTIIAMRFGATLTSSGDFFD